MGAILQGKNERQILGTNAVRIGKRSDNQLQIKEAADHHAEIRLMRMTYKTSKGSDVPTKQQYVIVDLGSQKGTFVNGQKLTPQKARPLKNGDTIRIGNKTFTYRSSSSGGGGGAGAFLFLILLIIVGIAVASTQSTSTPDKTLSAYCNALKTKDYQTVYSQLASSLQNKETEQQFAAKITHPGDLKDCVVGTVQANGSTATSTLTYTFVNGKVATISHLSTVLINDHGTWKINSLKP